MSEIRALVHQATHDESAYTIEGGFVDTHRYHAEDIIQKLQTIFDQRGFTKDDESIIRNAVRDPSASLRTSTVLLSQLLPRTKPLIKQLRSDPLPHARILALRAGTAPVDFLNDPDPQVRAEAISAIGIKWSQFFNAYPDLPDRIDLLLNDPSPSVRRDAADAHPYHYNELRPVAKSQLAARR